MMRCSKTRFLTAAAVLTLLGIAVFVVVEWQQIQIRYYIARFGKDRSFQSPHLYIDKSSQRLKAIGPAAIPYLADAYKTESRPNIRHLIVLTLWGIGDPRAGPTLVAALSDADAEVREEATLVVGKLKIQEARSRLRELLKESNARVRATAYFSLGEVGGADDLALLKDGMKDADSRAAAEAREAYLTAKKRAQ
ncbi:MAG: HEAT repeat domain-containing protein [Planctomycetes bacterium]|nr:HEAT repeat domain-containing protein [Planctomycetota bacterium]